MNISWVKPIYHHKHKRIKRSLIYSLWDGSFWAVMFGLGESYMTAFAVFLRAGSFQMGLIGSLPQLLGAVSQVFSNSLLMRAGTRKKLVVFSVVLQALMFVPIILAFYTGTWKVYHLLVFMCLYYVSGTIVLPAWNSWLGDLVPSFLRGRYFGSRYWLTGAVTFVAFFSGGLILQFGPRYFSEFGSFAFLFLIAMICRLCSGFTLTLHYEPPLELGTHASIRFLDIFINPKLRDFRIVSGFLCGIFFSVSVFSPFFVPYLLKELHFNYAELMLVIGMAMVSKFMSMTSWGKLIDRYGTKKVMTIVGILMPTNIVLFLFGHSLWYLLLIQILGGFIWGGFEIAALTYQYNTTTPQNRTQCVAYYGVLNGIAIFGGAMLGSLLMRIHLGDISPYIVLFLVSFLLRIATSAFFIRKFNEIQIVENISYRRLFLYVMLWRPLWDSALERVALKKK